MEHPSNVFVAGFLGIPPMNLFSGGFISGSKLVLEDLLIPLPKLIFSLVRNDQQVTLGVQHEAVSLAVQPISTNGIQLRGEVESFESDFVHHTHTVHVRTGGWHYAGVCSLDTPLRIGQQVYAAIDPERLYFFDTTSGQRL